MSEINQTSDRTGSEIAVIGMAGRFPGAANIEAFWENLKNGVESISFISDEELERLGIDAELRNNPNYVKSRGGALEHKELFDAFFFEYTPGEAEIMDPQMRILHQCAFTALENAGYDADRYEGSIGLYAGASFNSYWEALVTFSGKRDEYGQFITDSLVSRDFMTTRISYKLNLKGPSLLVQTACSTSLTAVHLACQAILNGECHLALAGGVKIEAYQNKGYLYQEGAIPSRDGHCRAFDAGATGAAGGEGAAVILLKLLEDAILDKDYIHAIIKGTAINNDGKAKIGYTAPSIEGQANVIRACHRTAEVNPESISYIETHGTGTDLGDPVEIEALKLAFNTDKRGFCAIGSVKTNIGHLDAAAGVTGLIKTVLALKHKQIPPSLNYQKPNPKIDFENSPFFVNTQLIPWKNDNYPLRAGVSSFGIGGTNAHAVLEEWANEDVTRKENSKQYRLILLSAKTQTALDQITSNSAVYFRRNPGVDLANAAYTLQVGRKILPYKRMLVCHDVEDAAKILTTPGSPGIYSFFNDRPNRPVIFMFPGQGSQYVRMGLGIYQTELLFQEEMDHCFEILKSLIDYDIKSILFPPIGGVESPSVAPGINDTEVTQPLLFIFEYSLAKLLLKWGIKPFAMIGHSIGEYVAACLSGVFSLADALKIVVMRGKLMQKILPGAMLAIPLSEEQLAPLLENNISLAAVNSTSHCVVSGPLDAVDNFAKKLKSLGYDGTPLHTSHAYHSTMMDPVLPQFEEVLKHITLYEPTLPYISNVTGNWITARETTDSTYWSKHLRRTVRFANGLEKLLKEEDAIFLEIGPGKTLSTFVMQHKNKNNSHSCIDMVRHPKAEQGDDFYLLTKIGQLWLNGKSIDWNLLYRDEDKYRIPLPTYPFEGQRYWLDENLIKRKFDAFPGQSPAQKKAALANWVYTSSWSQSQITDFHHLELPSIPVWLIFTDDAGLGLQLAERLNKEGKKVVSVQAGSRFTKISAVHYIIDPRQVGDYVALLTELKNRKEIPGMVVHSWNFSDPTTGDKQSRETFNNAQSHGLHSLIFLVQVIDKLNISDEINLMVISSNIQDVTGMDPLCPGKATSLGAVKVIPQEYRNIKCRSIDIEFAKTGTGPDSFNKEVTQLLTEFSMESPHMVVAYRNNRRWIQNYDPIPIKSSEKKHTPLKKKGVYIITGGYGNIGLLLAGYLAETVQARLVLVGRSGVPAPARWDEWLKNHGESDSISRKIKQIQHMETAGAKVLLLQADVADEGDMRRVLRQTGQEFGSINGVIHAAGIVAGNAYKPLEETGPTICDMHFHPKAAGIMTLEKVLAGRELDFCLIMSSLSAILGGLGFTAYAAANIFMDFFVLDHNRHSDLKWTTIDWDGWNFNTPRNSNAAESSILPGEGIAIFEHILSWNKASHIIISTADIREKIEKWLQFDTQNEQNEITKPQNSPRHPQQQRSNLTSSYVPPRDPLEQEMANIWQEFFGIEPVGINDDFFELGGDSLKATILIGKIHKKMNVKIPLPELFKNSTIEKMAKFILKADENQYVSIQPVEKKEYYVLSSAQKRIYFIQQLEMQGTTYNLTIMVEIEGRLEKKKLVNAFKQLIQRHDSFRTSFKMVEDEAVQLIHDHVDFEIDCYEGNEEDKDKLIQEFIRPFDLSRAPLLRVGLMKMNENKYLLMADKHHIITDAISYTVFVRDFISLYLGNDLPELKLQYKDYAEWQNSNIRSEGIKKQEKYWGEKFKGKLPVLNLPTDFDRPVVQLFDGNTISIGKLGESETSSIKMVIKEKRTTMHVFLLAVFNIMLFKYTNQEDIIVGITSAGRIHSDLDTIIGMFVNMLALRNFPSPKKTFTDFLGEVNECSLEAYQNQDFQFEGLVEKLKLKRELNRNPLFEVVFQFQGIEVFSSSQADQLEKTDICINPYLFDYNKAKYDLLLSATETGNDILFGFNYRKNLFKESTIRTMGIYLKNIISEVVRNPAIMISDIKMVSHTDELNLLKNLKQQKNITLAKTTDISSDIDKKKEVIFNF